MSWGGDFMGRAKKRQSRRMRPELMRQAILQPTTSRSLVMMGVQQKRPSRSEKIEVFCYRVELRIQ